MPTTFQSRSVQSTDTNFAPTLSTCLKLPFAFALLETDREGSSAWPLPFSNQGRISSSVWTSCISQNQDVPFVTLIDASVQTTNTSYLTHSTFASKKRARTSLQPYDPVNSTYVLPQPGSNLFVPKPKSNNFLPTNLLMPKTLSRLPLPRQRTLRHMGIRLFSRCPTDLDQLFFANFQLSIAVYPLKEDFLFRYRSISIVSQDVAHLPTPILKGWTFHHRPILTTPSTFVESPSCIHQFRGYVCWAHDELVWRWQHSCPPLLSWKTRPTFCHIALLAATRNTWSTCLQSTLFIICHNIKRSSGTNKKKTPISRLPFLSSNK